MSLHYLCIELNVKFHIFKLIAHISNAKKKNHALRFEILF